MRAEALKGHLDGPSQETPIMDRGGETRLPGDGLRTNVQVQRADQPGGGRASVGSAGSFAWARLPANPARLALGSPPGATEHGWVSTLPSS